MDVTPTLGEYVRRLRRRKRWGLQEVANSSGLSISHLSRIENDNAVPNADTVVKLATALEGDMKRMLEMADCLPQEILERYIRRADSGNSPLPRAAGQGIADPSFTEALVNDMDPDLRRALAQQFRLSDRDVDGIYTVLQGLARMDQTKRERILGLISAPFREGDL